MLNNFMTIQPALFIFALLGISGCQWSPTPDKTGNVVRTRVSNPAGMMLENVTTGYCPPNQNTFTGFELFHNQHGHWGTIPGDSHPRGTVKFSCPGYHDAIFSREDIPEEIKLRPNTG